MTVRLLAASYAAARRIIFLDDCCLPFYQRKNIGSSVLVTCTAIWATVLRDILLISTALDSEYTWTEAAHSLIFVVKSGGMMGDSFFCEAVPDDVSR